MTSYDPDLVKLVRTIVNGTLAESQRKVKVPGTLAGVVEDLDSDLDVVYVRMDQESMQSDPTVSDNYDFPGVMPVSRLGETYTDEAVRVTFDAISATASAMRTGVENKIVLPFGTEAGQRIILDGNEGAIGFFNEQDELVGFLDALQWFVGTSGVGLVRIDPIGGIRIWDINDQIRIMLGADDGIQVRDPVAGISGVSLRQDGIIVTDPDTGETISITSGGASSVPAPHWAATPSEVMTTAHATPDLHSHSYSGDDIDIRFTAASAPSNLGAQSYTPPAGYTEQSEAYLAGPISLLASVATRHPALQDPGVANFTASTSAFTRHIGHSVIVHGGGSLSPSVSGAQASPVQTFTSKTITTQFTAPPTIADGDIVLAHVAVASNVVPQSWATPPNSGWVQVGVHAAGLGTTDVLGSGIWYKVYKTGDPLTETVVINMNNVGTSKVQAMIVSISNAYKFPTGLDIKRNNVSMPRGQVAQEVETANTAAWTGADLPRHVTTVLPVRMLAGRKYSIEFVSPNNEFNVVTNPARMQMVIQASVNGGAWGNVRLVGQWQSPQVGVQRMPIIGSATYVPSADADIAWRVEIQDLITGGYTIQLLTGVTSVVQRTLTVTDEGAEY